MAEEPKKEEKGGKTETSKKSLSMQQLRDVFMNNCKHTNGSLSPEEENIVDRMIALVKTPEGCGRRSRSLLEEVQRWIPSGHKKDAEVALALAEAENM